MKPLFLALILCFVTPLLAQQPASTTENPLAQLKDELKRVLDQAQLPFSEEQDKAIILMMEDRRKASEELFGNLMDFSAGPTQGQDADRLRSAIEWMRNEFKTRLQDFLRPDQLAVWSRYQESGAQATTEGAPRARPAQQTQYVRINNNVFTTETSAYGGRRTGNDAEVIQRGGAGDYHGNAQLLLKDESLNAGKRFASNKPPYQERRASFNFSGPVIPGRLSTAVAANQNEAQNVDTIRATQPNGSIFALGITKPTTTRSFSVNNTFQIADAHSLALNVSYATDSRKNQGVGGFIMPDRASRFYGTDTKVELRQFSSLSSRSIFENSFAYTSGRDKTTPNTEGLKINVIDAFQNGGAQNKVDNTAKTYDFGNLYTHLGEKLSMKLGSSVVYQTNLAFSENNFTGTFTFSDLDAYRTGQPISFRMAQGNPEGRTNQWELGFFLQNDFKMTSRLTLMYGARYEVQTNVPDHNNLDPRLGFAYAAGRATVIRGGSGIFHDRLAMNIVEFYRRLDGTQQSEIVIDNPSYPDPFKSGSVRNTLPTIRVFDPNLRSPYSAISSLSIERTFLSNLFVSVAYDYGRILHKYRNRNLNATYDARVTNGVIQACTPGQPAASCVRPDPSRGNVINLESTGSQTYDNVRLNFRERFSIFNITASYQYYVSSADSPSIGLVLGGGNGQGAGGGGSDNNGGGPEVLPTDNYNLRADWSRFAVPVHTINGSVNSRLPLGIFLTSALAVNDGRYYTVTTGKDDNMDSSVNDRPAGVSRNSGDGQWSVSTNFNLSKAFFFGAKAANGGTQPNVNLFANMTNAFNRPNYNNPSGVMTSPNFGKITSAAEPRNIEVGMRFQF